MLIARLVLAVAVEGSSVLGGLVKGLSSIHCTAVFWRFLFEMALRIPGDAWMSCI
jgi:hypothetical protein